MHYTDLSRYVDRDLLRWKRPYRRHQGLDLKYRYRRFTSIWCRFYIVNVTSKYPKDRDLLSWNYGAYNHISQNQFERGDFHVTWYAFVLPNSHFRANSLFSYFLFEKLITCFVLPISQIQIVRRFTNFTNSDRFWLEFVNSVKRRIKN